MHGTANLALTASDPSGPGIFNVTVKIDGSPIYSGTPSTNGGKCVSVGTDPFSGAMIFDYQQPCPRASNSTFRSIRPSLQTEPTTCK